MPFCSTPYFSKSSLQCLARPTASRYHPDSAVMKKATNKQTDFSIPHLLPSPSPEMQASASL